MVVSRNGAAGSVGPSQVMAVADHFCGMSWIARRRWRAHGADRRKSARRFPAAVYSEFVRTNSILDSSWIRGFVREFDQVGFFRRFGSRGRFERRLRSWRRTIEQRFGAAGVEQLLHRRMKYVDALGDSLLILFGRKYAKEHVVQHDNGFLQLLRRDGPCGSSAKAFGRTALEPPDRRAPVFPVLSRVENVSHVT